MRSKVYKYGMSAVKVAVLYIAAWIMAKDMLLLFSEQGNYLQVYGFIEVFFPDAVLPTAVLTGAILLVRFTPKYAVSLWERIFCWAGALLCMLGYAFEKTNTWSLLYDNATCVVFSVLAFAGMTVFLNLLLCWCKACCRMLLSCSVPEVLRKLRLDSFCVAWLVILLCWLPYIIIRYPAGIEWDAYHQIQQALGMEPMTAHWPPFSSVMMGGIVWLGWKLFGSYNIGAFGYVIFQALFCSGVLAYSIKTMRKMGVNRSWCYLSLGIYSIVPIYACYLTAIVKDAMFSAMVVLFVILLAEIMLCDHKKWHYAGVFSTGLLMCLLRNNGIYIVSVMTLAFGVCILLTRKKRYVMLVSLLVSVFLLNMGYNHLLSAWGIPEGSIREALSIPFQQTARFVRDCPQDVTEEEAQIIDAVLGYEDLASRYDPVLSDQVKGGYHGDTEALKAYFKVWFRQFLRRPTVYISATLNNTYGWYSPLTQSIFFYDHTWSDDVLKFEEPKALEDLKMKLVSHVWRFEEIPGLMFLGNTAVHFWATVYLFIKMIEKRDWKKGLLLLPSIIGILVCLASPTYNHNGVRYGLPVLYCVPFLIGLCMFHRSQNVE